MEDQYRLIIRNEIDIFCDLFKQWVATFKKDEYKDEGIVCLNSFDNENTLFTQFKSNRSQL
jgi:hypothetical protein